MRFILLIIAFVMSFSAFADCEFSQKYNISVNAPTTPISVPKDTPVGAVIWSTVAVPFATVSYNCSLVSEMNYLMEYNGGIKSPLSHVYQTMVKGIGIEIREGNWSMDNGIFDNPANSMSKSMGNFANADTVVSLIKTENDAGGGTLSAGVLGREYGGKGNDLQLTLVNDIVIGSPGCTLSQTSLGFTLGNIPVEQFKGVGQVSQTTDSQTFSMDCEAGTNINVTLSGAQSSDSTDDSILALTSGVGAATGVGVQLLYNNAPLELNKSLLLKTSQGGQETFALTARYIQTQEQITAGSANAVATLDISYQ